MYLGEKVERAVITIPSYFNASQQQSTKDDEKNGSIHYRMHIIKAIQYQETYICDIGLTLLNDTPCTLNLYII